MGYIIIQVLALVGFVLSLYAFIVWKKKEKVKSYRAVCDFNDKVSCTKAFSSEYGKIFGLSNSFYGMIFYVVVFVLSIFNQSNYVFYLSLISVVGSIYLTYILYFKVKSVCVVCNGIYLVNVLLLVFSYFNL